MGYCSYMTEPEPDEARVAAVMRLSGARFESPGMPADALAEISAFEELLRSLVKQYWRDRHPGRKRLDRGYDDQIKLRLTTIEQGSSMPVLEYDAQLDSEDLFGPSEIYTDFERAIDVIEQFVNMAQNRSKEIPHDIRRLPAATLKKFGQSIRGGEAIQIARRIPASWDSVALYTPEVRREALVDLVGTFTNSVRVEGKVIGFDVVGGLLTVRDREQKRNIVIPYREADLDAHIISASQLFECEADGVGEFNADGFLLRLTDVISLRVTEVTEDALAARAAIENISYLNEGWMDGESGEPVSSSVVERAHTVVEALISHGNITRSVTPTEGGGISFYWPNSENRLTIEVEPSSALYIHAVNLVERTFREATVSPEVVELGAVLEDWLAEAMNE